VFEKDVFMKKQLTYVWWALVAGMLLSLAADGLAAEKANKKKNAWVTLFDGSNTDHWRSFRKDELNDGWKIKDGALVRAGRGAGDIITREQYESFVLVLEYRISKGGNSGLMFHVGESESTPWKTGPEIQIQDNVDGHDPQKSGWLYQFYQAKTDATKPVGEWNELKVRIHPKKSTVWMNGVKYYDFVKGSDEWNALLAKSKFSGMPKFSKLTKGHIALQDHGDEVAFRNIKIRVLK
jgi:hypothetical protein